MAAPAAQRSNNGVSPSSSPRLPSPPPFTEVQFGPKSPSVSGAVSEFSLDNKADDGASRRIRPGTKAVDMARGPPFVPLHQLESPFQLQEYLQSLYAKVTYDENTKMLKRVDKEIALELAAPPTAQDSGDVVEPNMWLYELCRLLCNKTSRLIVAFFNDNPPCSSQTCPEMRASEWQYLCAVHEPPKSCCAIDYCNHTLDWASNILSSNKHFPSRLSLGGDDGTASQSMKQLTNIFRRVYRIYAHAWFQHREVFWEIEAEYGLYVLFKTVCDQYRLIPEDSYTIPPEAEGERVLKELQATRLSPELVGHVSILRKNSDKPDPPAEEQATSTLSTGATTRRHKHTPSTGVPVPVIAEGQEEEEETTVLDAGELDTVQVSSSSSPAEPRAERTMSPGFIEIPENTHPDQAPEMPTPIAHQDLNPFGSPGPAEPTDVTPDVDTSDAPAMVGQVANDESAISEDPVATTHVPDDPNTSETVIDNVEVSDGSKTSEAEREVHDATKDDKNPNADNDDDESMGKIELSELVDTTKQDPVESKEESEDSSVDTAEKVSSQQAA